MKRIKHGISGLAIIIFLVKAASAETITIGKGSGIMWEGLPYNVTLSGPLDNAAINPNYGLLSISNSNSACMTSISLTNIGGYNAYKIAQGVGLVPRATGEANYGLYLGGTATLTGSLGLPETVGQTSSGVTIQSPSGRAWCLPPAMGTTPFFYNKDYNRTALISGSWVLVADGTQSASQVTIPPMYAGSFSSSSSGDKSSIILPSNITLRISSLECTVNTPTVISFNDVGRKTVANTELASASYPLITNCGQATDRINANINLQFRALSGLFENMPTRLSLSQGGGYITGEISNSVTGLGVCSTTTGLPFNNTPVKLGNITSAEYTKNFTNQITWRLCSGGNNLPSGLVDASAEMQVTFN